MSLFIRHIANNKDFSFANVRTHTVILTKGVFIWLKKQDPTSSCFDDISSANAGTQSPLLPVIVEEA